MNNNMINKTTNINSNQLPILSISINLIFAFINLFIFSSLCYGDSTLTPQRFKRVHITIKAGTEDGDYFPNNEFSFQGNLSELNRKYPFKGSNLENPSQFEKALNKIFDNGNVFFNGSNPISSLAPGQESRITYLVPINHPVKMNLIFSLKERDSIQAGGPGLVYIITWVFGFPQRLILGDDVLAAKYSLTLDESKGITKSQFNSLNNTTVTFEIEPLEETELNPVALIEVQEDYSRRTGKWSNFTDKDLTNINNIFYGIIP